MKLIQIGEIVTYNDLTFDIMLDYYLDEELGLPCVDEELGNKNLQKIKDKYKELKKGI